MTLGERIAYYRKQNKISQEKLAEYLNISRQAVTKWENNKSMPSTEHLIELSRIFNVDISRLTDERIEADSGYNHENKNNRLPSSNMSAAAFLVFISLVLVLGYIAIGIIVNNIDAGTVICMVTIGLMCHGVIHFCFSYAMKNNDFSMIAGFDPKVEINLEEYKRVIRAIDFRVGISSVTTNLLMFIIAIFGKGAFSMDSDMGGVLFSGLIIFYCLDMTFAIFYINYKNMDKIYINKIDIEISKAGSISAIWYVLLVCVFCFAMIIKAAFFNMKNNTPGAMASTGWLFFAIIIATAEVFYEQNRAKKLIKADRTYTLSKSFWLTNILSIIIIFLMFK